MKLMQHFPIQILAGFLEEIDKLMLKFTRNEKYLEKPKQI
jgi:hypothetical protein